jgi:hypothetical protein
MPPLPSMPAMPWRLARYCPLAERWEAGSEDRVADPLGPHAEDSSGVTCHRHQPVPPGTASPLLGAGA